MGNTMGGGRHRLTNVTSRFLDRIEQDNPLLKPFTAPHGAPPLDRVKAAHFLPAIREGIIEAKKEIEAIKNNPEQPDFKNTIEALEFSGRLLSRVTSVFRNIATAHSNNDIRAIEGTIATEMIAFGNDLMLDDVLFQRVKAVYDSEDIL